MGRFRVTVDTGGTFSDFVYFDEATEEVTIAKVPSTPDDPSRAILAGVDLLIARGVKPADIAYFCHGTTVGTNALLEGKGVRTGLVVTEGFRGIYEVQEQSRPHGPQIFDIFYDKPAMLAPQSRTIEAHERVAFDGEVLDCARRRKTPRGRARAEEDRRRTPSPSACCFPSCIRSTKSACARSSKRKCPAAMFRSRARSCRRFASTTGSRPPSSTPTSSRSWRTTSPISTAAFRARG